MEYTTNPKTPGQWAKYIAVVLVALLMIYLLLRTFVL